MTPQRLSQIGVGVLLLIVIRSLGEFFRLQYVHGDALTMAQVEPYVGSALLTAIVLAVALACHAWGRYRIVIGVAIATVLLLLAYKIVFIG
jgi:multisubunit Na+/H+ antiporter MnhC subunit